jgi:predicted RNase H-like nuclease (RuvC/YqgF family)
VPVDPDTAAADEAEPAPRKIGRPRKWASEAERKRAYRERLAADHAEPERLRRELRNAKRRIADRDRRIAEAERDLARADAEIERRSRREIELEGTVRRLEAKVDDWRSRANALSRNLEAERANGASSSTTPPRSGTRPSRPVAPTKRTTPKKPKRR